jgi:small conductance mechanosensitive channel
MHHFLLLSATRTGWFAEGRFLGRVLDEWAIDAQEFVRLKLPHLLVVVAIAFVLIRLLRTVSYRMIHVAEEHASSPARIGQVKTLAGVIRTTGLAVIGLIAGLQILDAVGVNLAPLLASAGVAGIAIGLAAQNIVKDVLNGILLLVEDQFNVGDQIHAAGVAGTVESMTLRKTTIRDADGTLYIVPNSQITTVSNLSRGYSVATINVSVDFSANPDAVLQLLTGIAMELRNSEAFRDLFVEDPKVLGVDAMKGSEIIFPVVFKTIATKQYEPVREFRRRVRIALEEQHLLPGDPNRVFNFTVPTESKNRTVQTETE